ncbi:hypothetical protein B0J11DRAFT_321776 [Dendryphion nanum]|uniref:Uncharacterized protein n=1 Tax=Dendryphion nanum TaxID=256645 RepID=A0A9P9DNA1_9PLEO|nr:hypothetical protein B0J11DRAFT_321776 [Dendryphion nanum]
MSGTVVSAAWPCRANNATGWLIEAAFAFSLQVAVVAGEESSRGRWSSDLGRKYRGRGGAPCDDLMHDADRAILATVSPANP